MQVLQNVGRPLRLRFGITTNADLAGTKASMIRFISPALSVLVVGHTNTGSAASPTLPIVRNGTRNATAKMANGGRVDDPLRRAAGADVSADILVAEGETRSGAILSACLKYRYQLLRKWSDGKAVLFVMLNPSRARDVIKLIREAGHTPMALHINADGSPKHPLYIPRSAEPVVLP